MTRAIQLILFVIISFSVGAQDLPSKSEILDDLKHVNQYYMNNYPETESVSTGEPNWLEGAYYNGHMALFDLYPTEKAVKYALQWATHNTWSIGNRPHEADNQCVGQTYMNLYYAFGAQDDYMLSKVGTSVQNLVNRSAVNEWDWIDALYMAMPVLTRYGIYYNDTRYFEKLYAMYNSTKVSQRLYNSSVDLWYRDGKVLSGAKKTCYWSRGNGWVFGAHVRTLQYLPEDDSHRQDYINTFKKMAAKLITVQRSDGFWNASLDDASYYPGPETSGTAFFVYGLAWGINNNILDADTYLPAVIKGWNGLISKALDTNGRIGYVQGVADEPKDDQPVTFAKSRQYGEGNFLLAGTEVIKLASGEMPVPEEFFVKQVEVLNATTLKVSFFEPADKTTAEDRANYAINKNVQIESITLSEDGLSCQLVLTNIYKGAHGIAFNNIKSASNKLIAEGSGKYFMQTQGQALPIAQNKQKQIDVGVYPNPVNQNYINLVLNTTQNGAVMVKVFDTSGKLLLLKSFELHQASLNQKLFINDLSKGVYILNIEGSGFSVNKKLMVN